MSTLLLLAMVFMSHTWGLENNSCFKILSFGRKKQEEWKYLVGIRRARLGALFSKYFAVRPKAGL